MENWKLRKDGKGRQKTLLESEADLREEDYKRIQDGLKNKEKVKSKQKGEKGENNTFREDDDFE